MSEWPLIFSLKGVAFQLNTLFFYDSKVNGEGIQHVRKYLGVLNFAALSFGLEAQVVYLNNCITKIYKLSLESCLI